MGNPDFPSSGVRILVVDDNEPWRRQIRSILKKREEFEVVGEAADGLEAIQKAHTLKPDLILLDIGLPGVNGIEVAKRLCPAPCCAKVLFLSQNNDPDVVQAALSNGARGYILKTDAGSELLPAIGAVFRGESYVSRRTKARRR